MEVLDFAADAAKIRVFVDMQQAVLVGQAGFLAEHVAKGLHIPYLRRMLYQKENRKKQSELDFMARFENVNENFVVRKPMLVSGKTILVIDDVCTSRATLNECARALKMAGAKEVYCATVATTA